MIRYLFASLLILIFSNAFASCNILNSPESNAVSRNDPIAILLHSDITCPTDVFLFRAALKKSNFILEPTMVANRGFHNPSAGSFSIFEIVSGPGVERGDFFFGHFTTVDEKNYLIADQSVEKNSLMIEAFAWDPKQHLFNFYELRGDGKQGQWYYRGNSADIFADNELLHHQPDPKHPSFGSRLRCSACHDAGGPIMKELHFPYNDWWTPQRKLDFGGREADPVLKDILNNLVSAEQLRESVLRGVKKFHAEQVKTLSLQEKLRPLFCPMEINFMSDNYPNENNQSDITIPTDFIFDKRLYSQTNIITISRVDYEYILTKSNSHFPEISENDADHAWLTPVKAESDKIAIDHLEESGLIDKKFIADVLAIDISNPVFSQARCRLLRFVPEEGANWQAEFIKNLLQSHETYARELASNMTDPLHTVQFYQLKATLLIQKCRAKLKNKEAIEKFYHLLLQRRAEIRASEISANPRGQILEPGFRVIFPITDLVSVPGELTLNDYCDVVKSTPLA